MEITTTRPPKTISLDNITEDHYQRKVVVTVCIMEYQSATQTVPLMKLWQQFRIYISSSFVKQVNWSSKAFSYSYSSIRRGRPIITAKSGRNWFENISLISEFHVYNYNKKNNIFHGKFSTKLQNINCNIFHIKSTTKHARGKLTSKASPIFL